MTLGLRKREDLAGFDPRELPGLEAWFSARRPAGFGAATPADNTPLATWRDLSGNGRDLGQAVGPQQPVWRKPGANLLTAAAANVTGWSAESTATVTNNNTDHPEHGNAVKCVIPGTNSYEGCFSPSTFSAVGGTTYTLSAWIYYSGVPRFFRFLLYGGTTAVVVSGVGHNGGGWQRVSFTASASATQANCAVFIDAGGTPFAATFYVAQVQVELGGTLTPWVPPLTCPGVLSDGVDDVMQTAYSWAQGQGAASIYILATDLVYPSSSKELGVFYTGTADTRFQIYDGANSLFVLMGQSVVSFAQQSINVPHVYGAAHSTAAGFVNLDGAETAVPFNINMGGLNGPFYLGYPGQNYFGMHHEVAIYSRYHDKATRRRVTNWLAARYAVPLARP